MHPCGARAIERRRCHASLQRTGACCKYAFPPIALGVHILGPPSTYVHPIFCFCFFFEEEEQPYRTAVLVTASQTEHVKSSKQLRRAGTVRGARFGALEAGRRAAWKEKKRAHARVGRHCHPAGPHRRSMTTTPRRALGCCDPAAARSRLSTSVQPRKQSGALADHARRDGCDVIDDRRPLGHGHPTGPPDGSS
jgi:hypothetical protein